MFGDHKDNIQRIAEELAEEQYGISYEDLGDLEQSEIYDKAYQRYQEGY
jgi:hypothetical protein